MFHLAGHVHAISAPAMVVPAQPWSLVVCASRNDDTGL